HAAGGADAVKGCKLQANSLSLIAPFPLWRFLMSRAARTRCFIRPRRGAALVEFALTAPLLFFILFASLEFARANMLRNTVEMAAYEGARRGIVPGATAEDVRDAARFPLTTIFVRNA